MKRVVKWMLIFVLFLIVGCTSNEENTIMTTSFPGYDFVRAIIKNSDLKVEMLVKPGSETHDFEPTPGDIIKISNSKLFVIVGGESDEWIEDVLDNIKVKTIKMIDFVEVLDEEIVPGMEEEEKESDEHIWTSMPNAIKIIESLKDEIIKLDVKNKDLYEKNANNYINELKKIDAEIRLAVDSSIKKEIVVADRFPFLYFAKEYGLTYYAAFKGCSDATEASPKTIAFLIDKVKKDNIKYIFHIELSNQKIAKTISKETNAKILELHSAHNISLEDFNKNITFVDIMKNNLNNLKEALK